MPLKFLIVQEALDHTELHTLDLDNFQQMSAVSLVYKNPGHTANEEYFIEII